jgi:hypothetical protein
MTRYANYDHTVTPLSPVLGWYDTDVFYYPSLPPVEDLIIVTDSTTWNNRTTGQWGVQAGVIIPIVTPSPTTPLQQSAIAAIYAGIVLTSIGTGTLNGTYDVSPPSQTSISGVIAGIGAGIGLPGGGGTFNWFDTNGSPHAFSAVNFKNFATAVSSYTYTLNQIIGGAILTLPDFNISIA